MESKDTPTSTIHTAHLHDDDRLVYVMPEDSFVRQTDDEIDLGELWEAAWRGKWIIIAISALFAIVAIVYSLRATEWYRAEVLLTPTEDKSTQGFNSQFGGLASIAGISVGGRNVTAEPVAVLQSREFARGFIEELNLMPVLFADEWNAQTQTGTNGDPTKQPDLRDAVRYFRENLLRVKTNSETGLVTLELEWTDAELAAEWASLLVTRLNDRMRQRALKEAETNVEYLQSELADASVVAIQQSIGRLLESELQKLMLARGNLEFSFRVIDPAVAPKYRSRPKRTRIVVVGTMVGGIVGIFAVFLLRKPRRKRHTAHEEDPA